jgi:hypothetical protein
VHALLQEFQRAPSDSRDVGLSKAMARVLITEVGKVRAAPALPRIRAMIAGGGSYPRAASRPPSPPRVLGAASGAAGEIVEQREPRVSPASPRALAAIKAAVSGRFD